MEIYLDKDFVRNFWTFRPNDQNVWDDFEKEFLKKISNFKLITNYQSIEEMATNEKDSIFLELFADKMNQRIEFVGEKTKEEWIEESISNSGGFKIFLVELEDMAFDFFSSTAGYEFISTKNLEVVWKKYITKEVKKSIDIPPNSKDSDLFNEWRDLEMVKNSPTNSIIVVDKYILCDKSNQKIEDNLIPILDMIIPSKYFGRLDVLIIAEEIKSIERNRLTEVKVKEILDRFKKYFSKYQSIDLRFKILIHDKSFYPKDSMNFHDRFIYTNYYTLESGAGFNLFEGKKRICANSKVEIHFNFQSYYMRILPRHMEGLEKYIEKVKRMEVMKDRFKFYPDVECKLLN